jgi:hypothetical protein
MKKKILYLLFFYFSIVNIVYPSIQGGIFSSGNDIIIKIKSDVNISGAFSGFIISIRYLSSYGVSISNPTSSYGVILQTTVSSAPYIYKIYTHTSGNNIILNANVESEVFRITLSGGSGNGIFMVLNDAVTFANNGDLYIEIGGTDETNSSIPFYSATTEAPLPIELQSFTSSVNKNSIKLQWKTIKETNNKEFIVERKSLNTETWKNTATIEGKGNTNSVTEYNFTDKNLPAGKYDYRLKQVDYNGNFEYFDLNGTVEVGVPDKFELSQNYPNPFNPMTKIDYQLPMDSKVEIRMYDATGREVKTIVNEFAKAGYYTYELNANGLASGVYFYRIIASNNTNSFSKTLKLMLIK